MTTDKRWRLLRGGAVGHFTACDVGPSDESPGMFALSDQDGVVVVVSLQRDRLDDDHLPPSCLALTGRTEIGDVLVLGVRHRQGTIGAYPTGRYRALSLALDVPPETVSGDTVGAVRLGFSGLSAWSGLRNLTDAPVYSDDRRLTGWRLELQLPESTSAPLDDGFRLTIAPGYSVDGPSDRRSLAAPVYCRIESDQRRSIDDHLQRLDAVQALLAVCHHPDIKAVTGDVRLTIEASDGWHDFWEKDLISLEGPVPQQDFPNVTLDDLGGVDVVARWVRLVLDHHRAVEPLVRHTLDGQQTPESRLLSTAAAMEYWVGVHARSADWAKRDGRALPFALTARVHSAWREWIRHPAAWVERFWSTYLDLKHYRGDTAPDPAEVHALEVSGRWLLIAALLDDCAGTSVPSERLFSRSLWSIGRGVRATLFPAADG